MDIGTFDVSSDRLPSLLLGDESSLPYVKVDKGVELALPLVDLASGLWIAGNRFEPGTKIGTHRHTGPVHAFTLGGSWWYEESSRTMIKGSYLFEPAGITHALCVGDEPTEVVFHISGDQLNLDEKGTVEEIISAKSVLSAYIKRVAAEHDFIPKTTILNGSWSDSPKAPGRSRTSSSNSE